MSTFLTVLLIILIVLIVALVVLYFLGRRLQKRQEAQQEQMEAAKQTITMLVIDKKMMRLKDAGLPQQVIDQTPKLMRRNKLPIVKAKVGPKIMTLVADNKVYEIIPVKKEVRAVVSGIYIMDVRGLRGPLEAPPKKKKLLRRITDKLTGAQRRAEKEAAQLQQQEAKAKEEKAKAKAAKKAGKANKS